MRELIIYCDESVEKGRYYSDFYGGVLTESLHLHRIVAALEQKKADLHLHDEVKWGKVTANYLEKYKALMELFFEFVQAGELKVRIMFRQNAIEPTNLTHYNKEHGYFLLYYQFLKHAFGLRCCNPGGSPPVFLRIFFDELPDSKAKAELFKNHIHALQTLSELSRAGIKIRKRDISEVDSKKHVLLQCLDIVLGSMAFRLNDLHLVKQEGEKRRGKRTIAKDKLYRFILSKIRQTYPNFNVGVTTGIQGDVENRWRHAYRHWAFMPREFRVDNSKYK